MTKRTQLQVLIGILFLMLITAKDIMPFGKMVLQKKACEINIDQILIHKSLHDLQSMLSEDELKQLKTNYCESINKTIK